jgi:hypothetical protein
MSSTPVPARSEPTSQRRLMRRRTADRVAGRLDLAMAEGWSQYLIARYLDYRVSRFDGYPFLSRILTEAAPIAESGDPRDVRVSRSPRGHLCVIRLHGPDWSLILTPGRPVPGIVLAVEDQGRLADGVPIVWRLHPGQVQRQVIAMNLAILAALDTPAHLTQHHRQESQ